MEMKNPPPMMTEKMPTTKPPTTSSAVSRVSSQGASALIHERSITCKSQDLILHAPKRVLSPYKKASLGVAADRPQLFDWPGTPGGRPLSTNATCQLEKTENFEHSGTFSLG